MSRTHTSHRMRETSLLAYGQVPDLGEAQALVYRSIMELNMMGKHPTDREIARDNGIEDPNKVRPRRYELMKAGLIEEAGKRECEVTGRLAHTWRISRA